LAICFWANFTEHNLNLETMSSTENLNTNDGMPPIVAGQLPIGSIIMYGGARNDDWLAKQGWLFCDGRTLDMDQYQNLYSVIRGAHGQTGGHFNIPDCRKLIEKVTRKGTELVIPYEKYVLPNGLTVILAEDHSDPLVHVDITYHVGSAREEIGKSGFAHFFEHMMFQGSDHVANGDHFKIITEAGGTLNGSTNRDRTNYYETVPANQLEKMLWLESDRMGFLLDAVTQQKFEVQRATVKNERGQNYDNRPYGLASEYTSKNLYPYGHPYSWLTIGYIEELNKVGVNDLKNFFLRWYGPNNATITIGGDLNPKQTLAWVTKYFGSIPRGPVVKNASFPAPVLTADRYVSYIDNYAKLPLLSVTYPGVKVYDKDMSALDALSEIIGQGRNSIFYKNFVKTRKAAQASMSSSNTELGRRDHSACGSVPGANFSRC
jgi:zinc protease